MAENANKPKTEPVDPMKEMVEEAIAQIADGYDSPAIRAALEKFWKEYLKATFDDLRGKQDALVSLIALVGSQDNRIMRLLNFILAGK